MIIYPLPNGSEQMELGSEILACLLAHRQIRFWQKEAGGQLFARFRPGVMGVERVTGPRKTDRRSRFSYSPDRKAEQREINAMHALGLHYIGDWHTHPERVPRPSWLDNNTMSQCVQKSAHQAEGFLLVIVGIEEPPAGFSVSFFQCGRVHTLSALKTQPLASQRAWGPGGLLCQAEQSSSNAGKKAWPGHGAQSA